MTASAQTWVAFRVPCWRCYGEIWFTTLVWTQFCLENGGLHRGLPFAIKRTTLIGWKDFSKWWPPYGAVICNQKNILIVWTSGHFRGHSEVCNASEAPRRQTMNANWAKKQNRVSSELTLRCTTNATQVVMVSFRLNGVGQSLCPNPLYITVYIIHRYRILLRIIGSLSI